MGMNEKKDNVHGGGWRDRANCLGEDPELFFPTGNTVPAIFQTKEAIAVCRGCDVRDNCLDWALENSIDHGVFGGLSEDERRALKRKNARGKVQRNIGNTAI